MDSAGGQSGHAAALQQRLRLALGRALRSRDETAVSALRSALSAIGNAEAVPPDPAVRGGAGGPHFAGTTAGLGAGEARRRSLSASDVDAIVREQVRERELAAGDYDRGGHAARAARLRGEAGVLKAILAAQDPARGSAGS